MTTPRLARAGRSRFFIGIVAFILMIGFVAIFHSSQQQLDESRQLRLRCEQQQEALNARMQAIVEHKFRLEKSLEAERKEHLESKHNLEQKNKDQKDTHTKEALELNVRFESLQQHYKILETEHNDLVEECAKAKESHMEQINGLQRKVKSLQAQLQQAKSQKDREMQSLKLNLEHEKQKILDKLTQNSKSNELLLNTCKQKIFKLENTVNDYKNNCDFRPGNLQTMDNENTPMHNNEVLAKPIIERSFKEQEPVSDGLYKIAIKITNNTNKMHEINTVTLGDGSNLNNGNQLGKIRTGAILNSVENFQIAQKPLLSPDEQNAGMKGENLQQPPPLRVPLKPSTSAVNLKTPDDVNKRALPVASVASPTSEKMKRSSTVANDRNKEANGRGRSRPIPLGVAPVPDNFDVLLNNEEHNQSGNNNNNNNRYANVMEELSGKKDEAEKDNAAHEVKDNDFNLGDDKAEPKDHLQEVLDNMNNAAEDDTNNLFEPKLVGRPNKKENEDEDVDVEVVGNKHDKADGLLDGDDKLINEVVGDQGKEAAFPEGMHLEEAADDEEDDDYSNPGARKQEGVAVRN